MRIRPGVVGLLWAIAGLGYAPAWAQTLYVTTDSSVRGEYQFVYVGKDSTLTQNYSPSVQILGGAISNTLWVFNASRVNIQDGTANTLVAQEASHVSVSGPGVSIGTLRGRGGSSTEIADGTSNTLVFEETSSGNVRGGVTTGSLIVGGNANVNIFDGTSNTLLIEESGRANLRGGVRGDVRVDGNGSADITDGTSNTLLFSENASALVRGGTVSGSLIAEGNAVVDIQDGTANTLLLRENGTINLRGGSLSGAAIYSLGNGTLHLFALSYALTNPTAGTYQEYSGTYYDLTANFGDQFLQATYFAAASDVGNNIYNPTFAFTAVPEPSSLVLLAGAGLSFAGVLLRRPRRPRRRPHQSTRAPCA